MVFRRIKSDRIPWIVEVQDRNGQSKRASKRQWNGWQNQQTSKGENTGIHKKRNQGCGVIQDPRQASRKVRPPWGGSA